MGNVGRALGTVCAVVVLGTLMLMPVVPQDDPESITLASILIWDHDCLDIDGNQETMSGFEVAITADGVDLNVGGTILESLQVPYPCTQCVNDTAPGCLTCEQPLQQLLQGRGPGAYRLWVRAFDWESNVSDWSDPITKRFDSKKPRKPTGLRCR
jgi:hypothetical protein